MSAIPTDDLVTRNFLRHSLATIAYRAGKTVRDTPEAFAEFRVTPESRPCVEILTHMGDVLDWVLRLVRGDRNWTTAKPLPWNQEIARFFVALKALDDHFASDAPIGWDPGQLFQGGIADVLTHIGQLAMLRRLSGFKMKSESYVLADIAIGRVGLEQTAPNPRYEFD